MPSPAIGILGGTFDPVHMGHLYIASAVLMYLPIQSVRFLPSYLPVHRTSPLATVEDRIAMLELALKDQPDTVIDLREIERKEPSYMIDTLISLRNDYPDTPLGLILGMDAYQNITTWKRWQELLDYAHLIIINRHQVENAEAQSFLQARRCDDLEVLKSTLHGKVFSLRIAPCAISATKIRNCIKNNESIDELVPITVSKYIHDHHLYR